MKKIIFIFCCIFFICGFSERLYSHPLLSKSLSSETKQVGTYLDSSLFDFSAVPFADNERLEFIFNYKWGIINADAAKGYFYVHFDTINKIPVYRAGIIAHTDGVYSKFFNVREDFSSILNRENLLPISFSRKTLEGSYSVENYYSYNWSDKPAYILARIKKSEVEDYLEPDYDIALFLDSHTFDFTSMFYRIRCLDFSKLKQGFNYCLNFALGEDINPIIIRYRGLHIRTFKSRRIRVHEVDLQLVNGQQFNDNTVMKIFFTDDKNRIPVFWSSDIKHGRVRAYLCSYKNLKYPITAFIN